MNVLWLIVGCLIGLILSKLAPKRTDGVVGIRYQDPEKTTFKVDIQIEQPCVLHFKDRVVLKVVRGVNDSQN